MRRGTILLLEHQSWLSIFPELSAYVQIHYHKKLHPYIPALILVIERPAFFPPETRYEYATSSGDRSIDKEAGSGEPDPAYMKIVVIA
jgi:hypothetical protein